MHTPGSLTTRRAIYELICAEGPLTAAQIREKLDLGPKAVSGYLGGLSYNGWIRRGALGAWEPDPEGAHPAGNMWRDEDTLLSVGINP